MTRTERAVHAGPAARGLTVMVEGRSQNLRCLTEYEYVAACAPVYGSGKRVGGTARHSDRKCPCLPHLKQTRDVPYPPECCAGCCG